jgi:putative transcriptional regulator
VFHVKRTDRILTRRLALNLLPLLVSSVITTASRATPEIAPSAASFAGQLLIATPAMSDPRFAETVILLVRHDATGAMGIAVNRPVGWRPFAALMRAIGQDATGVTGQVRVFAGGPVQADVGFILHTEDYHRSGTIDIDGKIAMTSSPEILQDMAHRRGPAQSLIAFGYAGWGPGQLESELALRAWAMIPDDPRLVFDEDRADVWNAASQRAGSQP